jgi:ABC-2 type transport system permease protein/lipopolysaccharide transport system permease protein
MAVFAVFIDGVANIDTGDAPYALFAFIGLLPWAFFSSSVSRGSMILVFESSVLTKVRCPREVFPLASVAVSAYELCVSLVVLGALFVITGFEPRVTAVWVPLIFLVQVAFTVGLVLVVAPIVVHVRDLGIALPVLLQVGLFATPVAYGADAVSHGMQPVWAALNPLVGVIESYRQTMLYGFDPPARLLLPAAAAAVLWLVGGYLVFKRMETGIPDVA